MSTLSQINLPFTGLQAAYGEAARAHHSGHSGPVAAAASTASKPATVEDAIANAAAQTSVDFGFLIAQAQVESAMDPDARARTSSATGLYQFIDSTWLSTMQRHGERFGLGDIASQISTNASGAAYVADPAARASILALRNDPEIASLMAAGLAEDNRAHLTPILGRQPDHGELYLAHFLGAGGAGRFLSELQENPSQSAAALFRRPAAANRPVFYESNGSARSLAGVMEHLTNKIDRARVSAGAGSTPIPATAPPYIIADEAVFAPQGQPAITPQISPRPRAAIPLSAPLPLAPTSAQSSMSDLLKNAFGQSAHNASPSHQSAVQRAYHQLQALGF